MPAPNNPNTSAATAAITAKGDVTAAERLTAAGWLVMPPPGDEVAARLQRWDYPLPSAVTTAEEVETLLRETLMAVENGRPVRVAVVVDGHTWTGAANTEAEQ